MSHRNLLISVAAALLLVSGAACAQMPSGHSPHVSARRHPNLAAAQRLMERADTRIIQAQRANEWDLDGHAAHAKQLLEQAIDEMKAAAAASNHNHR